MTLKTTRFSTLSMWAVNIGLLLIMTGTALPLLRIGAGWYPYVYCAGAILTLVGRILQPSLPSSAPMRARRLSRIEIWSALMFCAGGFFMFYNAASQGRMDWIAFTLAGGAVQVYTSIMIPKAMKDDAKK
ncbi:MAG: hypothetical protein NC043_05345 [Muribaculaceae bacterium]|nr:hypothetical protein [Muribaculaceae bacterium]